MQQIFKNIGNLDIKADNKKFIITIVNWELYQDTNNTSDNKEDTDKNVKNENKHAHAPLKT